MQRQFRTARFRRLLELLEMVAECPVVELREVSETHGLEYIAEQMLAQELELI